MASIRKRRGKYVVVYYYTNENGEQKQKWESYDTEEEAKTRKAEVEYKQQVKRFIAPSKLTIRSMLKNLRRRSIPTPIFGALKLRRSRNP